MDMEPSEDRIGLALERSFGLRTFRPGQREAIEAVTRGTTPSQPENEGRDAVVVMPTGSGKSLCYQLAALLLEGTTVVISPLIALMKDQVDGLTAKGIAATCINSSVGGTETKRRIADMVKGAYKLVYIAPERLANEEFRRRLKATKVAMVVIDEAHCISQWGHDFRTDYLSVGEMLSEFPDARVMALTATATPEVQRDIVSQLHLGVAPRGAPFVEVLGFARPNLHIRVTDCRSADRKFARLTDLVRRLRTGIVYVATRKHAQMLYERLMKEIPETLGVRVLMYHGAMLDAQRSRVQQEFMSAEKVVVVATTAFGMGIDRSDIRFVAHWDIPGSVESYYQEIGRAGRDGKPSECELLFSYADVRVQEYFVDGANPDMETACRVWRMLKSYGTGELQFENEALAKTLGIKNVIAVGTVINVLVKQGVLTSSREGYGRGYFMSATADEADVRRIFLARREKLIRDRRRLRSMVNYAYYKGCRHKYILDYFGDRSSSQACGGCDNCDNKAGTIQHRETVIASVQPTVQVVNKGQMANDAKVENVDELLRRYVSIQNATRKLDAERVLLKGKLVAIMSARHEEQVDYVVDRQSVHIRCVPKTTYDLDCELLRQRLGAEYQCILEPDSKKLKMYMDDVVRCLAPIMCKVGVPSGERIDAAIRAGHITAEQVAGAIERHSDYSFAVLQRR